MEEIRIVNLRALIERFGSQAALADKLDISPGYISQMLNKTRPLSEKSARKYEKKINLTPCWFDTDRSDVRDKNLRILLDLKFDGRKELLEKELGESISESSINDVMARKIESLTGCKKHWLDGDHNSATAWSKSHAQPKQSAPSASGESVPNDLNNLMSVASPNTYQILDRIKQAAESGAITDEDMDLLDAISRRLASDKSRSNS